MCVVFARAAWGVPDMNWGTGRNTNTAMGWSLLGVAILIAAGLASGFSTVSNASFDAAAQDGQNAQASPAEFNSGTFLVGSAGPTAAINTDGNYYIGRTTKPGEPSFQRQVSRFLAKRNPPTRPDDFYRLRFTATRDGKSSGFTAKPKPVIRPGVGEKFTLDETSETGMAMPDEGVVVINGTAPLIAVRRGTVSSNGTKFAIEATSTHWLVVVIESVANNDVQIYFPESLVRPIACVTNDCWRFPNDANAPSAGTKLPATDPDCAALIEYAEWVLAQTP